MLMIALSFGKTCANIEKFVDSSSLKKGAKENFDFTEEGSLEQYQGVDIKKVNKQIVLR